MLWTGRSCRRRQCWLWRKRKRATGPASAPKLRQNRFKYSATSILDDLLSFGLIYCDPSREFNFWRPTPSALLTLGFRSHTDIPALKELEEWFDSQKEILGIAKLDSFFERTSKLASRRLKREIEGRETLGEFALEPDPSHLERIPPEESGFDLFRSDGPETVALSARVESPQSVV